MAKADAKPARKRPAESDKAPAAKKPKPASGSKGGKPTSKPAAAPEVLGRKERKALALERKAKRVKNFGLIQEVVQLWEDARRHDASVAKRSKLISTILSKVKGRLAELAGSHSASRVVQFCAKHGTDAERQLILKELEPKLLELSKSSYGHFVVSKLIKMAPKAALPGLAKHFRGHISELLRHPAGTHAVDDLWAVADTKLRNSMASEFYGREYTLFDSGTINNAAGAPAHLGGLLAGVDTAKRRAVIQQLSRDLLPIMEKGLVDCPLVHRLLAEYLEHAPASLVADAVEYLSGEPLLHMVHTKEGAKAACMVLAYGTVKDRKKAVRAMKGHVGAMARDEWGHLPLLTALSVVDDTSLLRKALLPDLQKDLAELAEHKYGHRVLLHLLHPGSSRHLPPQLAAIVSPPQKVYASGAAAGGKGAAAAAAAADEEGGAEAEVAGLGKQQQNGKKRKAVEPAPAAEEEEEEEQEGSEEEGEEEGSGKGSRPTSGPLGASKKDPEVRRRELLGGPDNASLAAALAALCAERAASLVRSQGGAEVLLEVCRGGEGGLLAEAVGEEALAAVHDALVAAVAAGSSAAAAAAGSGSDEEGREEEVAEEPALLNFFGSRMLRRLVLASADGGPSGAAASGFVEKLWRSALEGQCSRWVDTHAAKVLAALLHSGVPAVKPVAAAELRPLLPKGQSCEEWAAKFVSHGPKQQGRGKAAKRLVKG